MSSPLFGLFNKKRVLITGHTGFKGGWLSLWILSLGAKVCGFSDDVPTTPSFFESVKLGSEIEDCRGNVCDYAALKKCMDSFNPEIVFHLAAQPLVRLSYETPLNTYATNVMGTVNVLEAMRFTPSVRVGIIVTTDKCYKNLDWEYGYREIDELGGNDPYSASKACAELVFTSYQNSFFKSHSARIASVRAGNVFGGGDWATDRVVPDCMRNWSQKRPVVIRNPNAIRPWQHVLDPLAGYMTLAASLMTSEELAGQSFNFGPDRSSRKTVLQLVRTLQKYLPDLEYDVAGPSDSAKKEANLLFLNCDKAETYLDWRPTFSFEESVNLTADWYSAFYKLSTSKLSLADLTLKQIKDFESIKLKRET
jgi:CDP-glucose 4,6-dehydratase